MNSILFSLFLFSLFPSLAPAQSVDFGACQRGTKYDSTFAVAKDSVITIYSTNNFVQDALFSWSATPAFPKRRELQELFDSNSGEGSVAYIANHPLRLEYEQFLKKNESNHSYNLGCWGDLNLKWDIPNGSASASYPRTLFFLGRRRESTNISVRDDGRFVITFSNGDQMIRDAKTFAPVESPCFRESPRGVIRPAKNVGLVKRFSNLSYVCEGPVLELEAVSYPSQKAHAIVYSRKCGGIEKGVRLNATDLVVNLSKGTNIAAAYKFGGPYKIKNASEAVLSLLPAGASCLRSQIETYESPQFNQSENTPADSSFDIENAPLSAQ
jgi:hypothetical protein